MSPKRRKIQKEKKQRKRAALLLPGGRSRYALKVARRTRAAQETEQSE